MAATKPAADHGHDHGHQGDGFDWWKVLDAAVWVAVGLLVVTIVEMLVGRTLREKVAGAKLVQQASQFLAEQSPPAADRPIDSQ